MLYGALNASMIGQMKIVDDGLLPKENVCGAKGLNEIFKESLNKNRLLSSTP